jgi:hypothetical protein
LEELFRIALPDDLSAVLPGAGAEVDEMIGAADRVFIVLDDDEGIPLVTQSHEGLEKGGVVAGMETDGRFVEDVEDAA